MAKKSKARKDLPTASNRSILAQVLGCSLSQCDKLIAEGLADPNGPTKTRGNFPIIEWLAWYRKRTGEQRKEESPDHQIKIIRVEEARMNLDERKGKFITREQHILEIEQIVSILVQATERGPAELAARTGGRSAPENLKTLEAWFTAFRESLAPKG